MKEDDAWIFRIKASTNLIADRIQSIVLWVLINDFLSENVEDDITTRASTIRQPLYMKHLVLRAWALPRVKLFAWLPKYIVDRRQIG